MQSGSQQTKTELAVGRVGKQGLVFAGSPSSLFDDLIPRSTLKRSMAQFSFGSGFLRHVTLNQRCTEWGENVNGYVVETMGVSDTGQHCSRSCLNKARWKREVSIPLGAEH